MVKSDGPVIIMLMVTAVVFTAGCSGSRPSGLGIGDNRLSPCPDSPNCVESMSDGSKGFVPPIAYSGDQAKAMEILKQVVSNMRRVQVIEQTGNYLYVESTSKVCRFVDDVEFYFPGDARVIHVRSASRIGYSDLGANKKRVEAIRAAFQQAAAAQSAGESQ